MNIRSDYVAKHTGRCMSCQKKNNINAVTHGESRTRLYHIWVGLRQRRTKPYANIHPIISKEWLMYETFRKWALENGYDENLTIDRIDNRKGYSRRNCRWITREENAYRARKILSFDEEDALYERWKVSGLTQIQLAKENKFSRNTVQRAIKSYKQRNHGTLE